MGKSKMGGISFGHAPSLETMYIRQIWIVFVSTIWITFTTYFFFAGPSFVIVNVIVGNICGTGVGALCTIYDFWMPTFWGGELLIFGLGTFWSMGFFD